MSELSSEQVATLRRLWTETTLSTAAIGREMKLSKSTVVRRAHELGLSRPSPIKPGKKKKPRRVKHTVALPPLPSLMEK